MTIAHARALLTHCDLHIIEHQPKRNEQALRALAHWMIRFTPLVMPDPPAGIALDITGCQRVHHGERRLINTIANQLNWMHINARIVCASTLGCAWAVAHCTGRERCIIPAEKQRAVLAPLPVEALRLESTTITALRELNVQTVHDLLQLPRLEIASRFDSQLLHRLDQALGEVDEPIDPIRPVEPPHAECNFSGPVLQLEAIMHSIRAMLDNLAEQLHRREAGAKTIALHFQRIDAEPIEHRLNLSHPSRTPAHLWSLLKPTIENLHLGFGIERIIITAIDVERLPHQQLQRAGDTAAIENPAHIERAFGQLIDNLNHRLGPNRTVRAEPVESHLPERAFVAKPVIEHARNDTASHTLWSKQRNARTIQSTHDTALTRADRPSILFDRPEPARVIAMTPDGPITWLNWRSEDHRIITSIGPERIAAQWWSPTSSNTPANTPDRDYFKVQTDRGRWLWLFRPRHTTTWFIHGEWT